MPVHSQCQLLITLIYSLFFCCFSIPALSSDKIESVYRINICNLAPYPIAVHASTYLHNSYFFDDTRLEAGECEPIVETKHSQGKPSIHLNAYPIADDIVVNYFRAQEWFIKEWSNVGSNQNFGASDSGVSFCVSKDNPLLQRRVENTKVCDQHEKPRVYSEPIKFNSDGVGDWVVADFAICSKLTEISCGGSNSLTLHDLALWANDLYHAIKRLDFVENPPRYYEGVFPTAVGFSVRDSNGAFDIGIDVEEAMLSTPFDTPILLKGGDRIISFNGHPVFGKDIIKLVYEAGKNYGYNHANIVYFLRDGDLHKTSIGLFFDEYLWGNVFLNRNRACAHPIKASILAAINEFTFYQQNTATCVTNSFQKNSQQYVNFRSCKFYRDQILAAFKQFCNKANYTGELFGGVTFIGRSFIEKSFIKNVPALSGTKLHSRVLRAAILEGTEEGVRALFTSPPGASTKVILNEMKERAKLQGIIGVGFQLNSLITLGAVAPMVISSYSDL